MKTTPIIRRHLIVACTAAGLVAPAAARAGGPQDQATAVALFQQARKLVDAGDFEHACPKFAEAQKLLPTPGTALSLGDCYEKGGKLASAWGAFKQAEFFARGTGANDHQAEAQRRAAALVSKLAHLVVVVPPSAKVTGFEVRRDGDAIGEAQWGSPVPADVGWHKIEATAPGKKAWSTTVRIGTDGSSASVDVPILEDLPPLGDQAGGPWGARRVAGVVVGSVGAAGIVVASVLGIVAIVDNKASKTTCRQSDPAICKPTGYDLRVTAGRLADASTATFIAGGLALAGGGVLFFTDRPGTPGKSASTPRIEARPIVDGQTAGISIKGWW